MDTVRQLGPARKRAMCPLRACVQRVSKRGPSSKSWAGPRRMSSSMTEEGSSPARVASVPKSAARAKPAKRRGNSLGLGGLPGPWGEK
eukprot:5121892-Lingulodinium_polyedra.AAC.1